MKAWISGTEWNPEIDPTCAANLLATQLQREFNGQRIVFSTNGTGTIGHPRVEKETLIHTLYHKQNLTQNRSMTPMRSIKLQSFGTELREKNLCNPVLCKDVLAKTLRE